MEQGMKQTIGQRLQAARQAQGLSLQTVSKITKILPEQLAALEQDQYDKIPASTQVRGFVRIYARTLGMDEKPLLDELDNLFGFREEDKNLLITLPVKYVDSTVQKEPFFTPQKIAFFFAFLLFVLMCGIGVYRIYQVTSFRHAPGKIASQEEQIRKSPELKPSILEPVTKEQPTEGAQGTPSQIENMTVKRATPINPLKVEEKPQQQSTSASAPPPTAVDQQANSNTENVKIMRALPVSPEPVPNLEDHPRTKSGEIESDADSADEDNSDEPAVSFAEKNYKLVVQARKDSWIFIQVIEGGKPKQVFSGVLHKGEQKEFVGPRFQIRASNISQVEFILDGKSISVASAGEAPQDIILPATP
ncbi:helix-turn-helix domain-containing protein [Methylacidiphilum caldifontis]|nr:helix-turn-helix domain-containing protein [Methylacidiphilum caldifontis]